MRRSPIRFAAALTLFLLVVVRGADAQGVTSETERDDASSAAETATFLLVPVGARSIGLGGAVSAARGDIEGSLWNPASMAGLERSAIHLMGGEDFAASSRVVGGILAIRELRAGLTLLHYDLGTIEARDVGNGSLGTIDPSQTAFVLSAAYPVASWIDLGASWKLLRLSASCSENCGALDNTSTGHAFDVGVVAALPGNEGIRGGLLLRNLGGGISYAGGASDPLPARLRLGLELDLPSAFSPLESWAGGDLEMLVRVDVQETLSEFDDLDAHFGVEMGWKSVLLIRGGYAWSTEGRSGPTIGIGLRFKRLILDLGYAFNDFAQFDTGTPLQLSAGFGL